PVHPHDPHDPAAPPEHEQTVPRNERILEFAAVLLLSFATLATAWSGYQAALFSGKQSQKYAQASSLRLHSPNPSTAAGQFRIDDLLLFNRWLDAHETGNKGLQR